jgi:hypothetical protein
VILQIELNDEMAAELESVRRESNCSSTAQVAQECVEVVLAERRLPHVPGAALGARPFGTPSKEAELVGYPVHLEQL